MQQRVERTAPVAAACILLVILVIYLLFLTKTYYWDGVLFSIYIEGVQHQRMGSATLLHPNHLLYTAFGYGLYQLAMALGIAARAITVMQVANALLSATCALMVFHLCRGITRSHTIALSAMLLFAFGATWWKFSTDADAYIPSVLLTLLAIWFALKRRTGWLIGACACHVGAMLLHELSVFLYFPILLAVWMQDRSLRKPVLYVLASGAIVLLAYSLAFSQVDHQHYPTLLSWVTSYASDTPVTRTVRQVVAGYLGSYTKLFFGGKASLAEQFFGPTMACSLLLVGAALAAAVWLWRRTKSGDVEKSIDLVDPELTAVLWAWFLPLAVFLAMFDPASTFHKLFLWPPMVLLIAAFVAGRPGLRIKENAFLALAIAVGAWNFGVFIWPHSHAGADPVLALAQRLDREMPKTATVYYAAFSPDDWYLDYFAPGRNWKPLELGQRTGARESAPVCLESTALEVKAGKPLGKPDLSWDLVNNQHNIRVRCWSGKSR